MTPLQIARAIAHRQPGDVDRVVSLIAGSDRDALQAWTVIERGGLLPALGLLAHSACDDRLGERHRAALRSAVEVSALRNALVRRLAIDATRHLEAERLPVLWAKGVWLAHDVYEQPAARPMSDADIFVPMGKRREAVDVLCRHGYSPDAVTEAAALEVFADALEAPATLSPPGFTLSIDVHDQLDMSSSRAWPVDGLWRRARKERIGGIQVFLPAAEDGLRLTAVHAFKHGLDVRHLMTAICDVAAIARKQVLDLERASIGLDDPFEATALWVVLEATGPQVLPDVLRSLHERARQVLDRHGARRLAERLVRASDHGAFVRSQDFSLFGIGERGATPSAMTALVRGAGRWRRRRVAGAKARAEPDRRIGLRALNWRWAWTSYLAGRLAGRLARTSG